MKVTVDVECTPAEARAFMGLPDVEPLNDFLVEQMKSRMAQNIHSMQPGRADEVLVELRRYRPGPVLQADAKCGQGQHVGFRHGDAEKIEGVVSTA